METLINKQSDTEILKVITAAMDDTKTENVVVLSLKKLGAFADYLVIGSGTSDRQVASISDRIIDDLKKKAALRPIGVEGTQLGQWVLIDYGHIVCHIFLNEVRDFYRLEDMWQDADAINWQKLDEPTQTKKVKKPKPAAPAKKKPVKKTAKKPVKKTAPKKSPTKTKSKKKPKKK